MTPPTASARLGERLSAWRGSSFAVALRSLRNAFRARGARAHRRWSRRSSACSPALAYVGPVRAGVLRHRRARSIFAGQLAALALVTGTLAFGSLAAAAASSEAVRAGSPENEFLLARPVSLPALVAARGLADAVTDPVGGAVPAAGADRGDGRLAAAAGAPGRWRPRSRCCADRDLDARLRGAARGRALRPRPPAAHGLDGAAAGRGAVARDTVDARHLGDARARRRWRRSVAGMAPVLAFSPAVLDRARRWRRWCAAQPGHAVARGRARWLAPSPAAMLLTRRRSRAAPGCAAGKRPAPSGPRRRARRAPTARLPTAATKDLRLIVRDRSQLLALVAMPVIFIGVQIFGAAGWTWTTASLRADLLLRVLAGALHGAPSAR